MTDRAFNVLFLCTGSSACSILAESILRKDGGGRFNAYSAGSHPKGRVNSLALKTLEGRGLQEFCSNKEATCPLDIPSISIISEIWRSQTL